MKPWIGLVCALALAGCHFYFELDDGGAADAGTPVLPDADPRMIDAAPGTPDAEQCETVPEFLARFTECMDLSLWQSAGMCDVPAETTTAGVCSDCHAAGENDIFLSTSCEDTFNATKQLLYIRGLIRPGADSEGCFNSFAPGKWLGGGAAHTPPYTFSDTNAEAINTFFNDTYARYDNPEFDCTP
jgi:hypothetical protein